MADVYLKYVGSKPWTCDTRCRTGVAWHGNGDIQPVPEAAALELLKFPDQWELVTIKEALRFEQLKPAEVAKVIEDFDDGAEPKPAPKPKAKK